MSLQATEVKTKPPSARIIIERSLAKGFIEGSPTKLWKSRLQRSLRTQSAQGVDFDELQGVSQTWGVELSGWKLSAICDLQAGGKCGECRPKVRSVDELSA